MVLFILGLCVFLFGFFYLEDKLTKVFLILFPLLPALSIIDEEFYVDDRKEGYGCVLRLDVGYNAPRYIVVEENNKKDDLSLKGYTKPIGEGLIGSCIKYIYYEDMLGYKILLEIE